MNDSRHRWTFALLLAALLFPAVLATVFHEPQAMAGVPTREAVLANDAVSANTDLLAADLQPPSSYPTVAYRITVSLATGATLKWVTEVNNTPLTADAFNGGTALTAHTVYTFTVGGARSSTAGESLDYNLQVDGAVTVKILIVDRVEDGSL